MYLPLPQGGHLSSQGSATPPNQTIPVATPNTSTPKPRPQLEIMGGRAVKGRQLGSSGARPVSRLAAKKQPQGGGRRTASLKPAGKKTRQVGSDEEQRFKTSSVVGEGKPQLEKPCDSEKATSQTAGRKSAVAGKGRGAGVPGVPAWNQQEIGAGASDEERTPSMDCLLVEVESVENSQQETEPEPPRGKSYETQPEPPRGKSFETQPEPPRGKSYETQPEPPRGKSYKTQPGPPRGKSYETQPEPPRGKSYETQPEPPRGKSFETQPEPPRGKSYETQPEPPRGKSYKTQPGPPRGKSYETQPEPPRGKSFETQPEPPRGKSYETQPKPPRGKSYETQPQPPRGKSCKTQPEPPRGKSYKTRPQPPRGKSYETRPQPPAKRLNTSQAFRDLTNHPIPRAEGPRRVFNLSAAPVGHRGKKVGPLPSVPPRCMVTQPVLPLQSPVSAKPQPRSLHLFDFTEVSVLLCV